MDVTHTLWGVTPCLDGKFLVLKMSSILATEVTESKHIHTIKNQDESRSYRYPLLGSARIVIFHDICFTAHRSTLTNGLPTYSAHLRTGTASAGNLISGCNDDYQIVIGHNLSVFRGVSQVPWHLSK